MRISPINYSMQYVQQASKLSKNVKPENRQAASKTLSFGDLEYGQPRFDVVDEKGIFEIEDISDKKVGEKYLLHPTNPKYKNLTILFTPKTTARTNDGKLNIGFKGLSNISFGGSVWGSIRKDENGTDNVMKKAYTDFYDTGMKDKVVYVYRNENANKIKNDYNFFIPSDGDGTRYRDITKLQGGVTKPASRIPAQLNGYNMRLVQGILANFAKTSKLDDKVGFVEVKPAQGSAYAFLEGLASGQIPTDKPIVFSWGDNFSDIDITKLILYHEANDSGFTMLTLPVDTEGIKPIGAAKVKSDKNLEMTDFYEKPTDPEVLEQFVIPGTEDKYLGVVGPYIISPEVLTWIKESYSENPESFKDPQKGYDFSSKIIGKLVKEMSEYKIHDDDGNVKLMYAYEKPEEDTWSDLGSEKDFTAEMKNVKSGGFKNLPEEMRRTISKNIDRFGNISFDKKTKDTLNEFLEEYEIDLRNAIVYAK